MARKMANAKAKGSNNERNDDITDFLIIFEFVLFSPGIDAAAKFQALVLTYSQALLSPAAPKVS